MVKKVTPRQLKAIESLLTAGDKTEAAKAAGVSRKTIYRWLKQDAFKQALAEAEAEALDALSRELVVLGSKATTTLKEAMTRDTPASTRVRAADIVLARLLQLRELVTLEARILALEQALEAEQEREARLRRTV
jgi:phage terminase small subunit